MFPEGALDFIRSQRFPVIQPAENAVDDLLGLIFAEVLDEAVKEVLARQRVINFGFLIMVPKLGKVDDPVLARVLGFAIDLEHYFIGLEQHSSEGITAGWVAIGSGDLRSQGTRTRGRLRLLSHDAVNDREERKQKEENEKPDELLRVLEYLLRCIFLKRRQLLQAQKKHQKKGRCVAPFYDWGVAMSIAIGTTAAN